MRRIIPKFIKFSNTLLRDGLYVTISKSIACLKSPFQKRKWRKIYDKVKSIAIGKTNVAVIIPCYNYGEYLEEALRSVLNQKACCNKEIIIVNDGSTDEHTLCKLNQIERRGYQNVKIIHQNNKGLSAARNTAVSAAKAEYVTFLDADDKLRDDFLEKTIKVLNGCENIDIVYSYARIFGDMDAIWYTENLLNKKILKYNHIPATAVYRKSLWEKVGGYDERMTFGYEDWEFWIRCKKHGYKGFAIPEPLFEYRRHGKTMHSSAASKYSDIVNYIKLKHNL